MEKIPADLQGVPMSEADIARAVAIARPANLKVREAAEARLRFEDEPAGYLAFLNQDR